MIAMAQKIKDTPEIVKDLRAQEQQGKLRGISVKSTEINVNTSHCEKNKLVTISPGAHESSYTEKIFDVEASYETIFQNYAIAMNMS